MSSPVRARVAGSPCLAAVPALLLAACGGAEPDRAPAAAGVSAPLPERPDGKALVRELFDDARYDPNHPDVRVGIRPAPGDTLADTAERYASDLEEVRSRVTERLQQAREADAPFEAAREAYLAAASFWLREGDAREAARTLDEWAERAGERASDDLLGQRALAWMRVGEVENCVERHAPECCTLPLRGGGLHEAREGSTRASELWRELLARDPDDWSARWLLSVAAMTLGEWPDAVEPELRVTPRAPGDAEIGTFEDAAPALGLDVLSSAGGVAVEDLDGDGRLDVVFTDWRVGAPLRLFLQEQSGRFVDRTSAAGLDGQLGGLNVTHADYDGDGDADLLVARGAWRGPQRNSLLRNRGDGTFEDVTEEAGLARPMLPTQATPWADWDLDGDLDLFVGVEDAGRGPRLASQLFENVGGRFRDVARERGVDVVALVKGAAFGDVDGDGDPDLYVSAFGGENALFLNDREAGFRRVDAGVERPLRSFPTWFMDYDQDGRLDLFVAGYEFRTDALVRALAGEPSDGETLRLYRGVGGGELEDVTAEVGLDVSLAVMGAGFGDLTNDGYPDLYLGTGTPSYAALLPNALFVNDGGRRFVDVTSTARVGHLQKGHGIAFADLEGDGDLDLVVEMGGSKAGDRFPNAVYRNPGVEGRHFLTVELEGVRSNRRGIGASITVELENEDGEREERHATVGTGGSFGSSPFREHVGLGHARRVVALVVEWPGGEAQRFEDVPLDAHVRVREGAERVEVP